MDLSSVIQNFVSAKETQHGNPNFEKRKRKPEITGEMSGKEARTFYESVISSDNGRHSKRRESTKDLPVALDTKATCSRRKKSSPRVKPVPYCRLVNDFLKYAQDGNLSQIRKLVSDARIDINVCDKFSWTALMCSSHSGHYHVVKYLLEKGALWRDLKDPQGRTALDLAKLGGHSDIVEILLTYGGHTETKRKHRKRTHDEEGLHNRTKIKFWCSVCELEFTDDQKKHQSSTVHLFNCQRKPQRTFYYIPEGNIGYQMMLNSGWNEDQGLGPDGVGRKYPVKTVLKRDRLGLGSKKSQQPRVTHFGPYDSSAVKQKHASEKEKKKKKNRGEIRKERLTKEKKQKNWERNLRIYMNTE